MNIRIVLFLLFTVSYSVEVLAQDGYLMLRTRNNSHRYIFREGENIRFSLKGEDYYSVGKILEFKGDSLIRFAAKFNFVEIHIRDIERIDIREKQQYVLSSVLLLAGGGYIAIDRLNQLGFAPDHNEKKQVFLAGGTLMAAGVVLRLVKKKYFTAGNGNLILIINAK